MNIFIIDDLRLEGEEVFHVTLFTADSDVFLKTDITAIVIIDNEGLLLMYKLIPFLILCII